MFTEFSFGFWAYLGVFAAVVGYGLVKLVLHLNKGEK
jgi:hypothetical protein